ncbi:MAG: hypothetical protein LPK26_19045 [Bacillaceae bacterium]|nr:hypothetical protein [Bacillaceae bacterium]
MKEQQKHKNNDVGHRGESYQVYSAKATETEFEASYEFASGNKTSKSTKK